MIYLQRLQPGDRVRCTGPLNDGSLGINTDLVNVEGTVQMVGQFSSQLTEWVAVHWDNGLKLNLLPGDPVEMAIQLPAFVVPACDTCTAPGDVECEPGCANEDFRAAEFDGVLEE